MSSNNRHKNQTSVFLSKKRNPDNDIILLSGLYPHPFPFPVTSFCRDNKEQKDFLTRVHSDKEFYSSAEENVFITSCQMWALQKSRRRRRQQLRCSQEYVAAFANCHALLSKNTCSKCTKLTWNHRGAMILAHFALPDTRTNSRIHF